MGVMPLPAEGGCRCGRLRFRLSKAPLFTGVCHCKGCQRMSGGAYSTTVSIPAEGFELLVGTPALGGLKGPKALHHHCPDCKSWVFTRFERDMSRVNVRATMLDETAWFEPFVETCTDEALPWARLSVPHTYSGFPDPAEFPGLLEAFARIQGAE